MDTRPVPVGPKRASPPRRSRTLPNVTPGQWLSSGDVSEKQSIKEPEPDSSSPSTSTFGKRTKSVAERRKLFENEGVDATALSDKLAKVETQSKKYLESSSGTRVFSRGVTAQGTLPQSISEVAHRPLPPAHERKNSTETVRQVRRMPRLDVARSRTLPLIDHEWPLKSESPLRASFDSSSATAKSFEWKPTPARQRSLSRRRTIITAQDEICRRATETSRSSSAANGSSVVDEPNSTTSPRTVECEPIDSHLPQQESSVDQPGEKGSAACQKVSSSEDPDGRSRPNAAVSSIGFPSSHPTTSSGPPPPSQKTKPHSVSFPSRNPGSWAAKPNSSSLKAKIGIFESLSRESSIVESTQATTTGSQRLSRQPHSASLSYDPHHTKYVASVTKTADRIKSTLRRISETWERGQDPRLHSSSRPNADRCSHVLRCQINDNMEKDANPQGSSASGKKSSDFKENVGRRFFAPFTSFTRNTTASSRFEKTHPLRKDTECQSTNPDGPKPSFVAISDSSGSDNAGSAQSAPATTDVGTKASNHPSWRRRRATRSSGGGTSTMFALVQCRLEQPIPVRGDGDGELKRLLTFCRDNALRRRSRGRTG